jgi:hypothetical protein
MSETFYRKVRIDDDGCHRWIGARNIWGYGRLKRGGRMYGAHRVAWELMNGPIPDGLFVLHRCDNRGCVNPDHLFLGTQADNLRDMVEKGRHPFVRCAAPKGSRMVRLELKMPDKMRAALTAAAEQSGISCADVVRLAIYKKLDERAEPRAEAA